jgi:hypothetical protein
MEEMSKQDRQVHDAKRARRKRIGGGVARAVNLLAIPFYLLPFFAVAWVGYLSWIGVILATAFVVSVVAAPIVGLAGRKRLEAICHTIHLGMIIVLFPLAAAAVLLWPQGGGVWRPYGLEEDLATLEAQRAVPDMDNAAIRYESALAKLDMNDQPDFVFARDFFLHSELSQNPWKAENYPRASEWLDSHAQVVRELLQAGKMQKCRWPIRADDGGPYPVPHKRLRRGALLLLATANRDLGEGRIAQAMEKYFCLLRQGDHLYQQTDQLDLIYGLHAEADALHMVRYALIVDKSSPEDIERIAPSLPTAANTWQRDISNLVKFDRVRFARMMAWAYEINDQGKIRFAASFKPLVKKEQDGSSRLGRLWRLYWLMNMPLDPHGVWTMAEQEAADAAGFLERGPLLPRDSEFSPSFWSYLSFAGRILGSVPHLYAHTICISKDRYTGFGRIYAEHMTARRGTWLILGLRRYRNSHGAWPQTLDAISEYVPAEAFFDPIDGDAFVYTLDGDSFKLYSKGPNGIDEGGRHRYVKALNKVEDDIPIWPPPAAEPDDDESSDDEMLKQMEQIYGKGYMKTYRKKDKESDKR